MNNYSKLNIVITGGSSGIGLELSKLFASRGANILIIARRIDQLDRAISLLNQNRISDSQKFEFLSMDISDYPSVEKHISNWIKNGNIPDILINSAGVVHPGVVEGLEIEKFRWMMDVNYFGAVNIIKVLLPAFIEKRKGHIVNISSMAGFLGVYGYAAYSGSKFALRGFSDVLRAELKYYSIDVSVVFPPDTKTPQLEYEEKYKPDITRHLTSTSGVMEPEKVARDIISGMEKKKYIITPGFESSFFYQVASMTGNLVYPIMDLMIAQARREIAKKVDRAN